MPHEGITARSLADHEHHTIATDVKKKKEKPLRATVASDLAVFLKELRAINTFDGPVAEDHNFYWGGDLSIYHEQTQTALQNLKSISNRANSSWATS